MIETVDEELCDGCGVCVENCPVGILRVENGKAKVSKAHMCTDCSLCREVCPRQALQVT